MPLQNNTSGGLNAATGTNTLIMLNGTDNAPLIGVSSLSVLHPAHRILLWEWNFTFVDNTKW